MDKTLTYKNTGTAESTVRSGLTGIYVRRLGLPGVHTNFIERHRQVIDQLLGAVTPGSPVDNAESGTEAPVEPAEPDVALDDGAGRTPAARFARRHGFLHPPELVRFRILDPTVPTLGGARDIMVTAEAFSTIQLPVQTVIATENQINFLPCPSVPERWHYTAPAMDSRPGTRQLRSSCPIGTGAGYLGLGPRAPPVIEPVEI